jgi:hypothetical protein
VDLFLRQRHLYPKPEETTAYFLEIVTHNRFSVSLKETAVVALGQLDVKDQEVVDALFRALGDKDRDVRQAAAVALGQLGSQDQEVVDALRQALGDKASYVRRAAAVSVLRLVYLQHQGLSYLIARRPQEKPEAVLNNVRSLIEVAASGEPVELQAVFDTPHAVPLIIQGFLDKAAAESIYYALLFFSITKLQLAIASDLLPVLSDPDKDERTKQVVFRLLLRVELIEDGST